VEYEQNGADRAKYGENLIANITEKVKHIKGLTGNQLYICCNFYSTYPHFLPIVSKKLQHIDYKENIILRTLSVKSETITNEDTAILRSATVKSQNTINENNTILQSLTAKSETADLLDGYNLNPEYLLSNLTFTHFVELIRISDPLQRLFYEVETIKNNWSVRDLKRAIGTQLALRTTLSTNKSAIVAKITNSKPTNNTEILRNPYVLDFLDLSEKPEYSETDLEQQIINHLQEFLIELGTGFCFEARQKRITFNNRHYRIDLVFYHRILRCHILIDLKINEFDHADAGQMNLYLNYYKKNEMAEYDNPPIGIILCGDKDNTLVEYATSGMDEQLFVSKYLIQLPEKQVLENFIKQELA
jgi:predicted nuclease of restriction endonuclease-like (RecB) superfamily